MAGHSIPDMITTYNRVNVSGTEAFCLLLRRLAYPCRLSDIAKEFFGQRPMPVLSVVVKHMLDYLHDNFASRLLTTLDQPWLSPHRLQQFADSIHARGAALANCWAFMDSTSDTQDDRGPIPAYSSPPRVPWSGATSDIFKGFFSIISGIINLNI